MQKATFLETCAALTQELERQNTSVRVLRSMLLAPSGSLSPLKCYWSAADQVGIGRSSVRAAVMEIYDALGKVLLGWVIKHSNK